MINLNINNPESKKAYNNNIYIYYKIENRN